MLSRWRRHKNPLKAFDVIAQFARITDIDGVTFPSFNGCRDISASNDRENSHLGIFYAQAVTRQLFAFQVKIQKIPPGSSFGEDASCPGNVLQYHFEMRSDFFNLF